MQHSNIEIPLYVLTIACIVFAIFIIVILAMVIHLKTWAIGRDKAYMTLIKETREENSGVLEQFKAAAVMMGVILQKFDAGANQ